VEDRTVCLNIFYKDWNTRYKIMLILRKGEDGSVRDIYIYIYIYIVKEREGDMGIEMEDESMVESKIDNQRGIAREEGVREKEHSIYRNIQTERGRTGV
jgi:hypothetical protein